MKFFLIPVLLLLLFGEGTSAVRAATITSSYLYALSCVPSDSTQDVSEPLITFTCTMKKNSSTRRIAFDATLVGKREYKEQADVLSSTEVALSHDQDTVQKTLRFPVAFQRGVYTYSFALTDAKTGQALSNTVKYSWKLDTVRAMLKEASIVGADYDWGKPVSVRLSFDVPKGQSLEQEPLMLSIMMPDNQGRVCHTLTEQMMVRQSEDVYQLVLPGRNSCINSLVMLVRNKDGAVIDQKTLALHLTADKAVTESMVDTSSQKQNPLAGISKIWLGGLFLTIVVFIALGGYVLLRKKETTY